MTIGRAPPLAWEKSPRSVIPSAVLNSTLFDFAIRPAEAAFGFARSAVEIIVQFRFATKLS